MARKRRQYLVEKKVQGALGFRIAGHWLAFLGISVVVTTFLRMPRNLEQPLWDGFSVALVEQLPSITVFLALLPWFIHDSLKLSNRFAGPMIRLRNAIVELTNGDDLSPVKFRQGDFWGEMAEDFNALRSRVLNDRARSAASDTEETPVTCAQPIFVPEAVTAPSAPQAVC